MTNNFFQRKTKRRIEIESLRTQRSIASASNKRLRTEIKNESSSSQPSSSQSSYEPDSSDDGTDDVATLEPKVCEQIQHISVSYLFYISQWIIGNFDISAALVSFRNYSLGLHFQLHPLSDLQKMAINHIFIFDDTDEYKYSCTSSFPPVHSEPLIDFNLNQHFSQISFTEHELISRVSFVSTHYGENEK